jgi:hypothetical protein
VLEPPVDAIESVFREFQRLDQYNARGFGDAYGA